MENSRRIIFKTGVATSLIFLIPFASEAQSVAEEAAFTRHALTIGFLVLSVIILVFLGLMLKARVNELQAFLRKDSPRKKKATRWQELMSLDEDEVEILLDKRAQKQRPAHAEANRTIIRNP